MFEEILGLPVHVLVVHAVVVFVPLLAVLAIGVRGAPAVATPAGLGAGHPRRGRAGDRLRGRQVG